jgi:hypothetical protein
MQDGSELFDKLPLEIRGKIAERVSIHDLIRLRRTSTHLAFFKHLLDARLLRKLLHYVVCGEHDAVQLMLKNAMNLIYTRGRVTDCSGRTFENISPFEYALWALDKHMWTLMLACIPRNKEGKKILAQLLSQYEKVNTEGITYRLCGKRITEKHFDFANTIIKELQTQVDSINTSKAKDDIGKQWREGVGSAQKLLPMHVVYEYCSDVPFHPLPQFTFQPKKLSREFYNWITQEDENWFSDDSKLAVDFAIFKSTRRSAAADMNRGLPPMGRCCFLDLVAIKRLWQVRTTDFINLKSQLESQMAVDNQPQDFQMRPSKKKRLEYR